MSKWIAQLRIGSPPPWPVPSQRHHVIRQQHLGPIHQFDGAPTMPRSEVVVEVFWHSLPAWRSKKELCGHFCAWATSGQSFFNFHWRGQSVYIAIKQSELHIKETAQLLKQHWLKFSHCCTKTIQNPPIQININIHMQYKYTYAISIYMYVLQSIFTYTIYFKYHTYCTNKLTSCTDSSQRTSYSYRSFAPCSPSSVSSETKQGSLMGTLRVLNGY